MGLFTRLDEVLSEYSFDLAISESEQRAALRLKRDLYARRGLLARSNDTRHDDQLPPSGAAIFVAIRRGEVAGTVTIYPDSASGLPMDDVHPLEVRQMRSRFATIAEVGGLAIAQQARKSRIMLPLFHRLFRWCLEQKIEALVICVHPASAPVYGSLLKFTLLGHVREHPRYSAPSVPLGIDLVDARDQFRAAYLGLKEKMDLFSFFFSDLCVGTTNAESAGDSAKQTLERRSGKPSG
jgi:hypothetical protein